MSSVIRPSPHSLGVWLIGSLAFVCSGASGLLQQSIWSQHMTLLLGASAPAQAIVVAVFMGGLAIGAWWGQSKVRTPSLRTYAVSELVIAGYALVFPWVFAEFSSALHPMLVQHIDASWLWAYHISVCALLIGPSAALLGFTYPVFVNALRSASPSLLTSVSWWYAINSLGAALGVLWSTFYILPHWGLSGGLRVAALLSATAALTALCLRVAPHSAPAPPMQAPPASGASWTVAIACAAAAITGGTTLVYEIVWIRWINQLMGSSVHSFEVVVCVVIVGLATGSVMINLLSGWIKTPARVLVVIQLLMGLFALGSMWSLSDAFPETAHVISTLPKTSEGYDMFVRHGMWVSAVLILPTACCAGMTLPLLSAWLPSPKSVGLVYAFNTLGAMLGALLVSLVLMDLWGTRSSLQFAAACDLALGCLLAAWLLLQSPRPAGAVPKWITLCATTVFAAVLLLRFIPFPSPEQWASGVFRSGQAQADGRVVSFNDGRTATISVISDPIGRTSTISTNGKPDASMTWSLSDTPVSDEYMMALLASAPLHHQPLAEQVAVVGWGSGMTTHTVLGSRAVKSVDAIEIEPRMIAASRLFGARVARATTDPRVHIAVDDARSFFQTTPKVYDVIISEPSNPWVSGVSTLFTTEFYKIAKSKLRPQGVMAQWIHTYELNDELLATLLSAFNQEFPHAWVYQASPTDWLIVGSPSPLQVPILEVPWSPAAQTELKRLKLETGGDLLAARFAGPRLLSVYLSAMNASPHTDDHPVVMFEAPRARFIQQSADLLENSIRHSGLPVKRLLDPEFEEPRRQTPSPRAAAILRTLSDSSIPLTNAPSDPSIPLALPSLSTTILSPKWVDEAADVSRWTNPSTPDDLRVAAGIRLSGITLTHAGAPSSAWRLTAPSPKIKALENVLFALSGASAKDIQSAAQTALTEQKWSDAERYWLVSVHRLASIAQNQTCIAQAPTPVPEDSQHLQALNILLCPHS